MNERKITARNPAQLLGGSAGATECAVRGGLTLLFAWARIFGGLSPFAVAMTASAGTGAACIFSALGAAAGYLLSCDLMTALKYIAASLLSAAVANVFQTHPAAKTRWLMPMTAGMLTSMLGAVFCLSDGLALAESVRCLAEGGICALCTWFYTLALSPWKGNLNFEFTADTGHTAGVLLLLGTLMLTAANVRLFSSVSLGRTMAVLCALMFSYKAGAGTGSAAGAAVGILMDAREGTGLFFSGAYCLASLASGLLSRHRRFASAASFVLVNGAVCAAFGGGVAPLLECMIASVLFTAMPERWMSRFGAIVYSGASALGAERSREYICDHIDLASAAFHELYRTVKSAAGSPEQDGDIASVFDRAAAATCLTCENTNRCWFKNYETTKKVLQDATPLMMERGALGEDDLPDYFSRECLHYPDFITAINLEVRSLLYRRQYRNRLCANQRAAFNQYADMATILSELSGDIAAVGGGEPLMENRLQKYCLSLGLQTTVGVFRDRGGRLHVEMHGGTHAIVRERDYLEKLSAVAGTRLCTSSMPDRGDTLKLLEAEPLAAAIGISCRKKRGQAMSGDKGAYFKTDEGMLYVILSDGMGSGSAAARISADVVGILQRFLLSGVSPETAVKMLNDLMLLKNEDELGTATVDLVGVDLFTGDTVMYKYGASPSYILRNGLVRRLSGDSMAAGLGTEPENCPDRLRFKLTPGSVAVLVSDGVAPEADAWLMELIEKTENAEDLSRRIIAEAYERTGGADDMTAYVIRITQRE